jgi:NAD(P)-dependent dehydrogenase (short-subunit alcohol dehydrogenase family)
VTGGARGIGLATSQLLTAAGAHVAIADIDEPAAERAARQLPGAAAFGVDVGDREAVFRLRDDVERRLGAPDFLVNNAAVMALGPLLEVDESVVRRTITTNLIGVVNCMRAFGPAMKARGYGHVVNVSSAAGRWGIPGENVYCATKHAVAGLSEVARRELAGSKVHV